MKQPRGYHDKRDLEAMRSLLVAGRSADNGSYYIHTGDLNWWLYYPHWEGALWEHIHLWDDPDHPGRLLGWALITPGWVDFDVYVQPDLCGTMPAMEMCLWAEEEATRIAQKDGKKIIHLRWVRHNDGVYRRHFTERGFRLVPGMMHLTRSLDTALLPAQELGEFRVRACKGEPELTSRARAQYGAFGSTAPFISYLERFRKFMRSPVYCHNLDIVAVAPDGQIGAFCIVWIDPVNQVGLFEPVGTHPHFKRKGLGKAVMLEGLRRLQAGGMKQAIVSTEEDNLPAINFYESNGFRVTDKLGTYEKDV